MIARPPSLSVLAVAPVHEQMENRAQQEERVGECPEDVCLVLFPQEEERDGREQAEP
jgi:hypothetical protein